MSRLDELIKEYCPNGVEYKPLECVCGFQNGFAFKSSLFKTEGVPIIRITNIDRNEVISTDLKYIDTKDYKEDLSKYCVDKEDIIIAMSGATTGKIGINKTETSFLLNQRVGKFLPNSKYLLNRYLYHFLLTKTQYFYNAAGGGAQPNLSTKTIYETLIPVPPLPVQEEIVRILDTFTELTTELTAELTAELAARKNQYNYYLETLIKQHCLEGVEYRPIKEVYTRLKGTPITAGKMKDLNNDDGNIRIFAGGKTMINAFESDIPKANITRVPAVLVQSRGVIDFVYYDKPFTFKNEMWAYTHEETISVKYLFYVLKNDVQHFREAASGMGSLPQISLRITEDYLIPVLPLEVQKDIVQILDCFASISYDVSSGILAEIEARKKQYEYYRDKLMTFKEIY